MNITQKYDPGLMLFGDMVCFDGAIAELKIFLSSVSGFLKQSDKRLLHKYSAAGLGYEETSDNSLPEILFTSVVTATVSLLERQILTISTVLQKAISFPLSVNDLSGSWIERFPKFCKAAAGIDIRSNQRLWQDVSDSVAIRNCLVHSDGYLSESSSQTKRALALINRHKILCISEEHIVPNKQLARYILKVVSEFIEVVYRQAQDKYPRSK